MSTKNFGYMLIIFGFFISFVMFVFSDWTEQFSLLGNIRYSNLINYQYDCTMVTSIHQLCESFEFALGKALILPFSFIVIGLMVSLNIISEELTRKILPFLKSK
jgi:hypothetical protein